MTVPDSSWGRTRLDVERELAEMTQRAEQAEQQAAALRECVGTDDTVNRILSDLCDMEQDDPDDPDALIVTYDHLLLILNRHILGIGMEALAASGGAAPAERAGEAE